MGWTIFPSPHSPDLPTSDFHLFVPLKDALRGCCVLDNNDLQLSVCEELWCLSKQFYDTSIKPLMQSWKCVLMIKKILWKNNLHAVEDLPMKYVNFITIIIVSEEKNRHYLVLLLTHYQNQPQLLSRWRVIHCTLMSLYLYCLFLSELSYQIVIYTFHHSCMVWDNRKCFSFCIQLIAW
jgi:hypothetical protein